MASDQLHDAILRNLEVLGEAANNVKKADAAFTDAHPEVPWAVIVAMRNRLTHAYFAVDLKIVWATVREDLPSICGHLKRLHAQL